MKQRFALAFVVTVLATFSVIAQKAVDIPNPSINMKGFLKVAAKAAKYRETRRLTEDEFIKMSEEPGVVVLDARSKQRFDETHINGAVNLSFPDITVDSLATMFPDKNTTILIYCNNNFANTPAFPTKAPSASLNISTYISLYTYGYRNIYELGPLLDVKTTKLDLISSDTVVADRSASIK
ncbi:MAG: rhodanese-like domain-containing protein [Pyrinomonadaceae bacterium]